MRVLFAVLVLAAMAAPAPASAQAAVPTCQTPDLRVARAGVLYADAYSCTNYTSIRLVGVPAHLQVQTPWPGSYQVQADAGYTGRASFTFVASNVDGDSAPVTALYDVGPDANRPPQCYTPATPVVRLGDVKTVSFSCSDPESDPLTANQPTAVSGNVTTFGTLAVEYRPSATATPPLTDTISVRIGDGRDAITATASVNVKAAGYNTPPRCTGFLPATAYAGIATDLDMSCFDDEGDTITRGIVTAPAHGTLTPDSHNGYLYTAQAGYVGADSVTYSGDDGHGGTSTARIPINVVAPPAPNCYSHTTSIAVRPGQRAFFTVSCYSTSLQAVTQSVLAKPARGTVTGSDGYYAYDAGSDTGGDSVTVRAVAGGTPTDVIIPVTVTPAANIAPMCSFTPSLPIPATPTAFTLRTSATRHVAFTCMDADGDPLTVHLAGPANGTLTTVRETTDESGTLAYAAVYTPTASGDDTVAAQVTDDHDGAATTTFTFHVRPATNTPPACDGTYTDGNVRVGEPLVLTFICHDADADPVTYDAAASGVTVTSVSPAPRPDRDVVTVTVLAGATPGPASVTLTPSDTDVGTALTAPVDVRPADANFVPSCISPNYSVDSGGTVALGNPTTPCTDGDRDTLTATLTGPPSHGTIDTGYVYHADSGFVGNDTVSYAVADGHGGTATATLRINVSAAPGAPDTVVDAGASAVTNLRHPAITFRSPGHPAATFECLLAGPGRTGVWQPCTSPLSSGPLADGFWTLSVRAADGGVTDPTPAYQPIYVDATAPEPPVLTEQPTAVVTSGSATVRFEGAQSGELYECRLDNSGWTPCEPPRHLTGLPGGAHAFDVRIVDFSGNRSDPATATWTVPEDQPAASPTATVTMTATATQPATATATQTATTTVSPAQSATATPTPATSVVPTVTPFPTVAIGDPPARDTTPPHLGVSVPATTPRRIAAHGVTVPVGCDEACAAAATVSISKRTATRLGLGRHAMTIGRSPVTDATRRPLVVTFTKRVARAIRRARSVTLSITVVAVDAAGNAAREQTTVRPTR